MHRVSQDLLIFKVSCMPYVSPEKEGLCDTLNLGKGARQGHILSCIFEYVHEIHANKAENLHQYLRFASQ